MPSTFHPEPFPSASASSNLPAPLCPLCGAPLHNPRSCDRCDWVKGYGQPAPEMRHNPRDLFACILSLFWPGAGHFYKGHFTLAVVLASGGLFCFLWSVTFLMFLGPLILPVYWIAVAAQAFFLHDLKHPAPPASAAHC